jgi:hypothetical protein
VGVPDNRGNRCNSFQTEIKHFEVEKIMPYVTSIERLGIEKTMR